MAPARQILVPTDFSAYAERSLSYAQALARSWDASLVLLHALDPLEWLSGGVRGIALSGQDLDEVLASSETHAWSRLEGWAESAAASGLRAEAHVLRGVPAQVIVDAAARWNCALVVMPTHGRSGLDRIVFGSTCDEVVRQSRTPVLTIKPVMHGFTEPVADSLCIRRVLCPLSAADQSLAALPLAASFCAEFGAELRVVHVVDMPGPGAAALRAASAQDAPQWLREASAAYQNQFPVATEVLYGAPHRELARYTAEQGADLVVMATRGRTGLSLSHVLLGSVAERLLRAAACPVVTMRPQHWPAVCPAVQPAGGEPAKA